MDTIFNTGETATELREKYNPDGSIVRQAQLRMFEMLQYLDFVCKEQNISYRIDAGNVLGAVRHGGFIPWDDDVDIVLERKEYKKLCRWLSTHKHPQYVLQTFFSDPGYVGAWAVLRDTKSEYIQDSRLHNARKYKGLQIDIFPYENRIIMPFYHLSELITRKNHQWLIGRCNLVARCVYIVQYYILHPFFRMIGAIAGNPNVYMHSYGASFKVQHSKEALYPYKPIVFEKHEFPGPANPDVYLEEHYGKDYMLLPPIAQRNHHKASYNIWS